LLGAHQVVELLLLTAADSLSCLLLEPSGNPLGSAAQLSSIDQLGLSAGGPLLELLLYALDSGYAPVQVSQCALALLMPLDCD